MKDSRERRIAVCFGNFEKLKEKDLIARLMSLNLYAIFKSRMKKRIFHY